jgi:O-antigen ligase
MTTAIAFFTVLLIYSDLYFYLWQAKIINVMPGIWYALVVVLGLVSWIFFMGKGREAAQYNLGAYRQNQWQLFIWSVGFATIALFAYLISEQLPQELRALKTVFINVGMLSVFMIIFRGEKEVRAGQIAMVVVVLVSALNNFLDVAGITSFSVAEGRGAGFYVNPNVSGTLLVLGMILTTPILPERYRLYYCLLIGMAVVATFSRSSVIMWLVGIYGLGQSELFRLGRKAVAAMLATLVALILVMQFEENIIASLDLEKYLSEGARQRLHFEYETDDSTQGRLQVAIASWELIEQSPWVGHGLGSSNVQKTRVFPHNMFLLIGVEMGLLGVVAYLALFIVLWRKKGGISKVFVTALFCASLFSHNLLDYSTIWLAYALLIGTTIIRYRVEVGDRQSHMIADCRGGMGQRRYDLMSDAGDAIDGRDSRIRLVDNE